MDREKEFLENLAAGTLMLHKFFSNHLKKVVKKGNKDLLIRELVSLTIAKSFNYCLKPQYDGYPIKVLLIEKAKNVLAEAIAASKKEQRHESLDALEFIASNTPNALQLLEWKEAARKIRLIDEKAWLVIERQQQGYKNSEIAYQIGISEENLRQIICRLRAKIRQLIKDQGYF